MGKDPQNTKNRNARTLEEKAPPLLQDAYVTEIRYTPRKPSTLHGYNLADFMRMFRSDEDRGYLRVIDTDSAEVWYVKWKWTSGRWTGHYVFDSCVDGDIQAAVGRLLSQVAAVRAGSKRPTKDRQYG